MTVWNNNPIGSEPIMIVTKWRANPDPNYPAIHDETIAIFPGTGIELESLGLSTENKHAERPDDRA